MSMWLSKWKARESRGRGGAGAATGGPEVRAIDVGAASERTSAPRSHAVVIAGGGPTGLMLAGELALACVDVAIIERRESQALLGSRAGGLHARTLELLDQRGIVERFLAEGQIAQVAGFAGTMFDLSGFPTRHPYGLGLWQNHIERILAGWVDELGVRIYRGREVAGFVQDEAGVDIALFDGTTLRAQYLVGCDGGRSAVRKAAGIDFAGWEATASHLIAEVEMAQTPAFGTHRSAFGVHSFGRTEYEIRDGQVVYAERGPIRLMLTEPQVARGEPSLEDLRATLIAVCGTDYGVHSPAWISRFSDATRQAAAYRERRVLLAGDAAHVHAPDGGQGLQLGLQDAANLGWKLAQVVKGISPERLLDTYQTERHPVAARVLRTTMASVALRRADERTTALREVVAGLLDAQEPRRQLAAQLSGLDIRYDLGEGHPLLGRRIPDLELSVDGEAVRTYALLHAARPVLLNLGAKGALAIADPVDRVRAVDARYDGAWELPVLGEVAAPTAVLIRPDGYVAWVGEGSEAGLAEALALWFGGRDGG
ncbi:FAD-dependent monooxygenase [Lysobacter sp. BMK333-48F3]|uniref:FAD-dependent monooxygenase n=1 Tax=Lysobacter sp. BMK333-48F3 TaxID=2867962 RepID=UPI001C8BEB50|nr:FAD-dependent monooxygenase [Lysobacter sp. BMK333-48F3]MBX9401689.1 FAD-dependent monooxygenase [Lysobacter sp. BMK333-48F3]